MSEQREGGTWYDGTRRAQQIAPYKVVKVGQWARHFTGDGKEYYTNAFTSASQWEKPQEWLDHENKFGLVARTHLDGDPSLATAFGGTLGKTDVILAHAGDGNARERLEIDANQLINEMAFQHESYIKEAKLSDELRKLRNANFEIDFRLGLYDKKMHAFKQKVKLLEEGS